MHFYHNNSFSSLACGLGLGLAALADARISLGSASAFGIVATTAITSTGETDVTGEIAIYPDGASSITGFPPGKSGTVYGADPTANTAHKDAMSAYTAAAALTPTKVLTGQNLGGLTLGPGVYFFASSAQLTGTLTLTGNGDASSQFIFQIGSTLTTASASSVVLAKSAEGCNVFWQVGSSATLGTTTEFKGNILASASVTANSGVAVRGGLYALSAAVTLIDDAITALTSCTS